MVIYIVIVSLVVGVGAYLYTGKVDNEVTEAASDIIQFETGIDLEKLFKDANRNSPPPTQVPCQGLPERPAPGHTD